MTFPKRGLCWKKPRDSPPFWRWDGFAALTPLVKCYLCFPGRADGDTGSPIRFSPRRVGTGCCCSPFFPKIRLKKLNLGYLMCCGGVSAHSPHHGRKGVCSLELALVPQQLVSLPFMLLVPFLLKTWLIKLNLGYLVYYGGISAAHAMD